MLLLYDVKLTLTYYKILRQALINLMQLAEKGAFSNIGGSYTI